MAENAAVCAGEINNNRAVSKVYLAITGQNIIWPCALHVPVFVFSVVKLTTVNALQG